MCKYTLLSFLCLYLCFQVSAAFTAITPVVRQLTVLTSGILGCNSTAMALFNVTLHGLADPFEWSSQPHTQVASQQDEQDETDGSAADFGARAAAMADLSDWTGSNSTITAGRRSSSNSRNPSITSADIHSRRGSSGGGNAPSSNPRTELISGRRGTQRPRSTRSAAIRASEVPVSEGLVLPPVPGALPPVPALVRGNTAPTPKFLRWKPAHGGSHQKFVELRTKHRHNKAG